MTRQVKILLFSAALIAGLGLWMVLSRPTATSFPLPSPNGYDDFVKAANAVIADPGDFQRLNEEALEELVATNAEALKLLRLGLTRQCSVPTDQVITNFPSTMNDLPGQKRLAQLLSAEGRLAEFEQRPADAARSYLDTVRLGIEVSRGGLIIHRLVGIACEAIGLSRLAKLAPSLECERQRAITAELLDLDRRTVGWAEVSRVERLAAGYQARGKPFAWLVYRFQARRLNANAELKHKQIAAGLRLVATELALRCHRTSRGSAPASLAQLVPDYVSSVPLDPFTNQPLIYRGQGTNWLLYSVGVDGKDDGGKRTANRSAMAKGDLFYDSW